MGLIVVTGATTACTMGMGTGMLNTTNQQSVRIDGKPAATIRDCEPNTNITPIGMCTSMSNPAVASATAAALGVLTPQPCTPKPIGAWQTTNAGVHFCNKPCLSQGSNIQCAYGGNISIVSAGQAKVRN